MTTFHFPSIFVPLVGLVIS
nr:photosystem I subunit I [Scutellaria likiangensis]UML37731.1 photosystem I subunit I [Scutellaria likiangensis]